MASTYITKTPSSTTNQKTWTVSCWVKRAKLGSRQMIWGVNGDTSGNYFTQLEFNASDQLEFTQGGTVGDPFQTQMKTNAIYRDTNGWYHIVVAPDTTQGTESNRLKIYVNGEQITSFATANYPSQDEQFRWHYTGYAHSIGRSGSDSARYFDGIISHFHNIDGTQYQASDFGETDATTGEWKIKTAPSLTYGSFGTFILKDGNSVTDQSGRGNNWTVGGGTLTKTEDNPSNVFATLNPLVYNTSNKVYGFGNTAITSSPNNSGEWQSTQTTLGASTGKYYCEIKINAIGNYHTLGVGYQPNISNVTSTQNIGELSGSAGWRNNGQTGIGNSFDTGGNPSLNTYTTGDILGIAMDLTNSKLYFSKNGTWENSGVPTSGSTGTGSIRNLTSGEAYHFVIAPRGGSTYCNFGNGYFGSTQISSAGTNASGNGIFEFDVPNGFTALSTKGLNT